MSGNFHKGQVVFITKYALTKRITRTVVRESSDDGYAVVEWTGGLNNTAFLRKSDVHVDLDSALAHAREMQAKKIASLQKQIKKLQGQTIAVVDDECMS